MVSRSGRHHRACDRDVSVEGLLLGGGCEGNGAQVEEERTAQSSRICRDVDIESLIASNLWSQQMMCGVWRIGSKSNALVLIDFAALAVAPDTCPGRLPLGRDAERVFENVEITYQCLLVVGQQHAECAGRPAVEGTVDDNRAASWASDAQGACEMGRRGAGKQLCSDVRQDADALVECDDVWLRFNVEMENVAEFRQKRDSRWEFEFQLI